MKTSVQNSKGRATDGSHIFRANTAAGRQIKHGQGALFKEAKKEAGKEPEAGGCGKRWVGMRTNSGLSGQEVGKRTGFSHFETGLTCLFPHISTQVVDFPRMYDVRAFLRGRKFGFLSQTGLRTKRGKSRVWTLAGKSAGCYAKVRDVSRKFAQIMPVNPRWLASQARHKLGAPYGLFACAKRGRIVTGGTFF
jgi:hypothetical protein